MNKFFKYFLIFLSSLLVVVPIIYTVILFKTSQGAFEHSYNDSDSARKSNLRGEKVNASEDPISVLFLGIDENANRKKGSHKADKFRTDAMILSTFNSDKKQIRMFSMPRDTISYIPKVGYYDKITHAHAYGGPTASMDAVEATLNVPVDYYVRINMDAFVDAVNELGGIYYDVPYNLNEPNTNDTGRIKVKKGYQKLNGDEALAVARTRHQDSDLKRGQRQMELLKILFAKAQDVDSLNKLDDVIKIVGENSKHNLTYKEIRALATSYLRDNVEIKKSQLKGDDDYLNGIYYYNPDINSIMESSNMLREDLNLPKITDKHKFLNQRVIDHYGQLLPQTQIDEQLLGKNQNDTTSEDDDDETAQSNDDQSSSSSNSEDANTDSTQQNPNNANNENTSDSEAANSPSTGNQQQSQNTQNAPIDQY